MKEYRSDIDVLRAFAVIAVIVFHLGYLPNGYLGVDVFFVISGYLITAIIYCEILDQKFSILNFYQRRIRRILPLLFIVSYVALIYGLFVMLPHDLEDLAQSVLASNFSANNFLMFISSSDYWAVKNEYKPLMHTWSLGVEEQFYLVYPILLLGVSKIKLKYILHVLVYITILSIILFLFFGSPEARFYLLHFRFFELTLGGFCAIYFQKKTYALHFLKYIFLLSFVFLIIIIFLIEVNHQTGVLLTAICSAAFVTTGGLFSKNHITKKIFSNKLLIYIGKISFSLYMWHQLVFAFSRYAFFETIDLFRSILLVFISIILSVFTYHFVENLFRNSAIFSFKRVIVVLSIILIASGLTGFYLYKVGGIYKDFPSLGLNKSEVQTYGYNSIFKKDLLNLNYNESVRKLDKPFVENGLKKILVLGDSYGRDVMNILLEHPSSKAIQLNYFDINNISNYKNDLAERWQIADIIVIAANGYIGKEWVKSISGYYKFELDYNKIIVFGTKNFGYTNGIHYNRISSITDYSTYTVNMKDGVEKIEKQLSAEWKDRYISLIEPVKCKNNKVRVFDDNGKFLTHDTAHLTKAGAEFYAIALDETIVSMINDSSGRIKNAKILH